MRPSSTAALMGVMTGVLVPATVHAFVCTRVQDEAGEETGPSLTWFTRDLTFALHGQGTDDVPGDDELDVLRASFLPWGRLVDTNGAPHGDPPQELRPPFRTTDLTFTEAPGLSNRDRIGYDHLVPDANENLLIFRDGGWPLEESSSSIIALTTTTYNALTGEILDADIELNSATFHFTIVEDPGNGDMDLQNTTVHEIGHFLGLGHSDVQSATMFAQASEGETSKRVLQEDDRNAVVFKYPAGDDAGYSDALGCPPPGELTAIPTIRGSSPDDGMGGGCTATGTGAWAATAVLALLRRRRRAG